MAIVVSCAGDDPLALRLGNFLSKSKWLRSATVSVNDDEVTIEAGLGGVNKRDVRRLLEAFLASNRDLDGYSVTEFQDIFAVGLLQPTEKILRHACTLCGCITKTEDDLIVHKHLHSGFL